MSQGRTWRFFYGVVLAASLVMAANMGAQVIAGSPEDKAFQAISRETDSPKRLELLNAYVKNFPNSPDLAQIYEYFAISFRDLGNTNKEIEYAEKSLALKKDPELMMMLGRAEAIKGENLPKAIRDIKEATDLAARSKNNPPPGVSPKDWLANQENVISVAKQILEYAVERYKQIFVNRLSTETDPEKIIGLLDEFTGSVDDPSMRPLLYEQYTRNYLRLNNRAKVLEYAEKSLTISPENVEILAMATSAYLTLPMDLENAMAQAQRAVTIADGLDTKPKPAPMTDEQWAQQKVQLKTLAYSTRGLAELQKEETLSAAVTDLEKARDISPSDAVVLYRLGIAYWKSKKIDEAINALAKSAAVPSGIQSQATDLLVTYYKAAHNGSTEGLKELIEKSKPFPERPNSL